MTMSVANLRSRKRSYWALSNASRTFGSSFLKAALSILWSRSADSNMSRYLGNASNSLIVRAPGTAV